VFRWNVRIVRVPQLQSDPHCNFIPRKTKSGLSRKTFPEGLSFDISPAVSWQPG